MFALPLLILIIITPSIICLPLHLRISTGLLTTIFQKKPLMKMVAVNLLKPIHIGIMLVHCQLVLIGYYHQQTQHKEHRILPDFPLLVCVGEVLPQVCRGLICFGQVKGVLLTIILINRPFQIGISFESDECTANPSSILIMD